MDPRPKLLAEKLLDKSIKFEENLRPPHCDALILHSPDECKVCADSTMHQDDRRNLDVCNTGKRDRKFPCPAEQRRTLEGMHRWWGNTPSK